MQFQTSAHLSSLVNYIIASYFSQLSSVLIVNNSNCTTPLQHEYLVAVREAFVAQSLQGNLIGLQWIDVGKLKSTNDSPRPLEQQLLMAVDTPIEGFITILSDTEDFLHGRYYATRYAKLRLKDKRYLFLCEHENPQDFLATEILQFYPNHLMIIPRYATQSSEEQRNIKDTTIITTPPITTTAAAAAVTTTTLATPSPSPPPLTLPLPSTMHASTMAPKQTEIHKITTTATLNKFHNPLGGSWGISETNSRRTTTTKTTTKTTTTTSHGIAAILTDIPGMSLNRQYSDYYDCHYHRNHHHHHGDINFELWTQKFVGDAVGNLDAVRLGTFSPNQTFVREDDLKDGSGFGVGAGTIILKSTPVALLLPHNGEQRQHKQRVQLYPDKLSNLRGRPLRLGTITYVPYVVTNYVPPGTGHVDPIDESYGKRSVLYLGTEAEIVKTFCQQRNCHLLVQPYGSDNWGTIDYENETSSGMLGDVYTQHVELAIGCIYNWYDNITETSHVIGRSAVTILGPAPAQFPRWRINVMPFTNGVWLLLIFTMIVCMLVFYFLKWLHHRNTRSHRPFAKLHELKHIALDTFATFIQQPSAPTANQKTMAGRLFWAALLSATITIENTYSGQLKSMLTIPFFMEPVDTIKKWSATSWKWAAPSVIWVKTVEKSDLSHEQILTRHFEIRDYDFLYNATFRQDYGFGIERLQSGSFSFGDYITAPVLDKKIILKDDLYFDWTRAVAIRGWPLMDDFNRHVLRVIESGLYMHWERQLAAQYLNRQIQEIFLKLASGHGIKMPPQTLTVENISGPLFILLIGYAVAAMVCGLEMLWQKFGATILRRQHT